MGILNGRANHSLGAGAANAAETPVSGNTQFTFTASSAEQLTGRNVVAYKIGDYVKYGEDPNVVYGVQTAIDNDTVKAALADAGVEVDKVDPQPSDWLAWAVQGTMDKSPARPWDNPSVTRKVAEYLADNLTKLGTATPVTLGEATPVQDGESDGKYQATATLGEPGIYLFIDNSEATDSITKAVPMIVSSGKVDSTKNLTGIFTGETVNFKNTKNGEKTKVANKDSVSVGDTITYTLKGTVSNPAPASFQFVDKPGIGLTVLNDDEHPITLMAGDTPLTLNTDYTIDFSELDATTKPGELRGGANASFTVALTTVGLEKSKGKEVVMTYDAKVNEQAYGKDSVVNKIVNNEGEPVSTYVKLFKFSFKKTDAEGNALEGAVFKIEGTEGTTLPEGYTQNIMTSGQDGMVTFTGLASGWYKITEVSAPEGYMGYDADKDGSFLSFTIFILDGGKVTGFDQDIYGLVTADRNTVTKAMITFTNFKVKNVRNITDLPLTGAAGTMLFTVLGLLIAGAGALVYMKSRSVKHALRG